MLSEPVPTPPKMLIDAIRKVMDEAQRLKHCIGRSNQFIPRPSTSIESIPPLHLPFPDDILASIDSFGLQEHHSLQLKQRLSEQIHSSQNIILQAYNKTCRDVPNMPHAPNTLEGLRNAYELAYHKQHIAWLKQQISQWQIKLTIYQNQRAIQKQRPRRPTFNTEYTPFLEKYFEYNAYPSASDRLVLSQKSLMTPRQIEVWFQNHRNRAKREGKPLARLSSDLPLKISLDSLQEKTSSLPNPEEEIEEHSSDEDSGDDIHPFKSQRPSPNFTTETFADLRPSHAFPAPYRSNSANDPFPNDNGIFKFEPPLWRRHPTTKHSPLPAVNMDEFIMIFASKLHLREDSTARKARSSTPASHRPWFAATVTIMPSAPHPALVRPTRSLRPESPFTTIPALVSSRTFPSGSRFGTPDILPSCTRVSKVPKPSPLPRRTPNTTRFFNGSPSSSTSRSSSASSIMSTTTQSRSSSSSSTADPSTPTLSPTIQKQGLDFPVAALSDYLNMLSEQQSNQSTFRDLLTDCVSMKQIPPIAQYQMNSPLHIPPANYLEAQS